MDYAQDGDLSRYDNEDIADACEWDGDASSLVQSFIESGFIDEDSRGRHVHDWFDYAGRLIEKREQNKERKRRSRATKKDVTRPSRGQDEDSQSSHRATEPNPTEPNHKRLVVVDGQQVSQAKNSSSTLQKYFGVSINPIQEQKVDSYLQDGLTIEVVDAAAKLTREKGKGIDYFWGVIENCFTKGILTIQSFVEEQQRFEESRNQKPRGQPRTRGPTKPKLPAYQGEDDSEVSDEEYEAIQRRILERQGRVEK